MRHLKLLLVLILASPLPAAAQIRTGRSALPVLPSSAVGASAITSFSPAPALFPALSAPIAPAPGFVPAPQAAAVPAAAPARAAAASHLPLPERLQALFESLDAAHFLPEGSPAAQVRARVRSQLLAAARDYAAPEAELLETVAIEADRALVKIQKRLDKGTIDPSAKVRLSESDPALPASRRRARIGVYPVAADPFQWGHLLIALRAVGELGVDKVVFVLAGDDVRKPTMTPVDRRHPMGKEVLDIFAPFFEYSSIAVGTTFDGETNIFRILALNHEQRVEAWYMVGDDHYRLVDKNGNPDTLPKLERNYAMDMGHNTALHQLKVAFIRREAPAEAVPTDLKVRFLKHVGFEASSTQVRNGHYTLMPYTAYEHARRNGLYGVPPAPAKPAQPILNDSLRARVAAELARLFTMDGYLGYSLSTGEPNHLTSYMREPHILVRMSHPADLYRSSNEFPARIAGLLIVYDFASKEGIEQMSLTLTKTPSKK